MRTKPSLPRYSATTSQSSIEEHRVLPSPSPSHLISSHLTSTPPHRTAFLLEPRVPCGYIVSSRRLAGAMRTIGFRYSRLPEHPLLLSVLKLDGSSFELHVRRTATVGDLRVAVEGVFGGSPKEGEGKISWPHVWSHFCLCYEGHNLIDDKMQLRTLGIKDGDQLLFIRHLSATYTPLSNHPKSPANTCQQPCMSSPVSQVLHECEGSSVKDGEEIGGNNKEVASCVDESFEWDKEKEGFFQHTEFRLAHYLQKWFSYGMLCRRSKVNSDAQVSLSTIRRRHCLRTTSEG